MKNLKMANDAYTHINKLKNTRIQEKQFQTHATVVFP